MPTSTCVQQPNSSKQVKPSGSMNFSEADYERMAMTPMDEMFFNHEELACLVQNLAKLPAQGIAYIGTRNKREFCISNNEILRIVANQYMKDLSMIKVEEARTLKNSAAKKLLSKSVTTILLSKDFLPQFYEWNRSTRCLEYRSKDIFSATDYGRLKRNFILKVGRRMWKWYINASTHQLPCLHGEKNSAIPVLPVQQSVDAVVASTQPQIVPLGNVAYALASEELVDAIQQSISLSDDDDDGGEDELGKTKPRNAQPPQSVEEDDADDIMLASNSTESKTEDDDMGIDAMMIQEEDKPPDVPEAPIEREEIGMLHRNSIAAKDAGDDNSDATPPIQNHRPLAPPRRMPHHGGETIRAWMTAESTVQTPSRKPAVQKDAYSYGGDFIRAWILLKNDSVDSAF